MDLTSVQTVTKHYNWRGEHTAYKTNGTTIPCADDNSDYCVLRQMIADGQCQEVEPEVTEARKVYSSEGYLTGYDTNLGFIPKDLNNRLFSLLQQAIEAGRCRVEEPHKDTESLPKIDALIFCLVLDRKWPHLAGPIMRRFSYKPSKQANSVELDVRIRNLPASPKDLLPHVFSAMGVDRHLPSTRDIKTLQAGMMEIEVPVSLLQKLFKNERSRILPEIGSFLNDSLAEHYVRTNRPESKGPGIDWLMDHAPSFLTFAIVNIANVALQAFVLEYGGTIPGHVTEEQLQRSSLLFARRANGQVSFHRFLHQHEGSFGLSGAWDSTALRRLEVEGISSQLDFAFLTSRVRQLFDAGFAMEALVVANSAFEVALEFALVGAVSTNDKARNLMSAKGHGYRLDLLKKVVSTEKAGGLDSDEFSEFADALIQSNLMRNGFLHQLLVPTTGYWELAQLDRTVSDNIKYIVDPHLSFITLGRLIRLATSASNEIRALLLGELQKLKEWND